MTIQKNDSTSKHIQTLNYGSVLVRYDKTYVNNLIDIIEMSDGSYYEIYRDFKGRLVGIKLEEGDNENEQ